MTTNHGSLTGSCDADISTYWPITAGAPVLMWLLTWVIMVFLLSGCSDSGVGSPDDDLQRAACETTTSVCESRIEVANNLFVRYLRTFDLNKINPDIRRAMIIVHGLDRNYQGLYTTGIMAAKHANAFSETLVVSPYYQTADDNPQTDELFWTIGGWSVGHYSSIDGPRPRISSYDVMDQLIRSIADSGHFPALEEVVIVGHSAGGQFVHRYASGNRAEDHFPALRFRYVVANPSSYLYVGPERPDGQGGFAIPDREACPNYNNWHRGLEERNNYMNQLSETQIRINLTGRDVRILGGDQDTGTTDLDETCGGYLQGANRYERSQNIVAYMDTFFPGHSHTGVTVTGVGHSSRLMFTSNTGNSHIFDP